MDLARRPAGAPLVGMLLLVVGLVLLLGNLGALDYDLGDLIQDWWPLVLIALGLSHLFQGRFQSALVLLVLGAGFLLFTLDLLERSFFGRWWPLGVILVGVGMVLRFFRSPRAPALDADGEPMIDPGHTFRIFQMLGESRRAVTSQAFRGGEATALAGGVEVDLSQARLVPGGARIDATAILGGIVLAVPRDCGVVVTGAPLLGGVIDKREPRSDPSADATGPRLEVRATVLMGGLEIR